MNLDKHELKLLAAAMALADAGSPVRLALLAGVFERPGRLNAVVRTLELHQFITFDPHQAVLRVLPERVWRALNEFGVTPELFTAERPLDEALAMVSRANMTGKHPTSNIQHRTSNERVAVNDTDLCDLTRAENHAGPGQPAPKPPEPPPPEPPEKHRILCPSLPALRKNFAESSAGTLRAPGVLPASLRVLKEEHKGIKPLTDFETLSDALADIEAGDEATAYRAMCGILGGVVMEGGDMDPRTRQERLGDGGKWRNRHRVNRARTHRVFAALVEMIKEGTVKSRGGKVQALWDEFTEANRQ